MEASNTLLKDKTEQIKEILLHNNAINEDYANGSFSYDLNKLYIKSMIDLDTLDIKIKKIQSVVQGQIKNSSDIQALTISFDDKEVEDKNNKIVIEGLDSKIRRYESDLPSIKLKSFRDITYDSSYVIARAKYCIKYDYPYYVEYSDGTNVLVDDVVSNIGLSYLHRFDILYKQAYIESFKRNEPFDYNLVIGSNVFDRISSILGKIQKKCVEIYNRKCNITPDIERKISGYTLDENNNDDEILRATIGMVSEVNPFMNADDITFNESIMHHELTDDRRNGQR